MKCLGCYKKIEKKEYCLSCRKKLFDGKRVSTVLDFDKPKAENITMYNEHSKRMSISGVQLKYSLKLVGNKLGNYTHLHSINVQNWVGVGLFLDLCLKINKW